MTSKDKGSVAVTGLPMLLTLGVGTGRSNDVVKAVARGIGAIRPSVIGLLVSEASKDNTGILESLLTEQGVDYSLPLLSAITRDPDDIDECMRATLGLLDEMKHNGVDLSSCVIDPTSGTVAMRVGLTLAVIATTSKLYIQIVGGVRESGLVRSGTEITREFVPSVYFAERDFKTACVLIQNNRFEAALDLVRKVLTSLPSLPKGLRRRAEALRLVAEAYRAWDLFDHAEAARKFGELEMKGLKKGIEELMPGPKTLGKLKALGSRGRGGTRLSVGALGDLLANAERREKEGRYDDAAARYYRGVEMAAQIALARIDIDSADIDLKAVPDLQLRRELARNRDADGRVRAGLSLQYRILASKEDPLGELERELSGVLQIRNRSILAHGVCPVKGDGVEKLRELAFKAAGLLVRRIAADPMKDPLSGVSKAAIELVAVYRFPWDREEA